MEHVLLTEYQKLAEDYAKSAKGSVSAADFCPDIDILERTRTELGMQVKSLSRGAAKKYKDLAGQIEAAEKSRRNESTHIDVINEQWLDGKLSDNQREQALSKLNPVRFNPGKTREFTPAQKISRKPVELGLKSSSAPKTPDVKKQDKVAELDKKL